jgi:ATP-dependent RNA helicase DDX52/ROK1
VSKQFAICSLGRTGRAGREGKAVTYFTDEDAPFLKTFVIDYILFLSLQPNTILPLALPTSCYNPGHQFQIGYSNYQNHPK